MMDEGTVRQQLDEIKDALKRNEEEKEVLLSLLHGYEGWLRIHGMTNGAGHQTAFPAMAVDIRKPAPATKGERSFRQSVMEVVRDARGEPLHAREILRRAQVLGGRTEAADPEAVTDLVLYGMKKNTPVEKVSPRTWRWTGEPDERVTTLRPVEEKAI